MKTSAAVVPLLAALISCGGAIRATGQSAAPPGGASTSRLPVPGVTAPMAFDYLLADRDAGRVYLPVPSVGALEVLDVARGTFRSVGGFAVGEGEWRGHKVKTGPSAVAVGLGVVYVGDHASSEVCAVDATSLTLGACVHLGSPPDGIVYVATTREVWVTTPDAGALAILDASDPAHLREAGKVETDGAPEGYAVDDLRGLVFTNTGKGATLAIDAKTRRVRSTWRPGCNDDGPRGLAIDPARELLVVACTDHVQVLDMAHHGALRGRIDTGPGVDNLDYLPSHQLLFAAAGRAATLTVAHVGEGGELTRLAAIPTVKGARNAVVDADGRAYAPDPAGAALLVVTAAAP